MRKLIIIAIFLFAPFKVFAGFPEGEKGYDYKKIEEVLIFDLIFSYHALSKLLFENDLFLTKKVVF